jgi:dolichyl-phosphate-mannose-protein mannosyltransferase
VEFIFNIEPLSEDELTTPHLNTSAITTTTNNSTPVRPGSAKGEKVIVQRKQTRPVREAISSQGLWMAWAATGIIYSVVLWSFWFFAPLTYGNPGLSVEEVQKRKWLGYDLHFAK